MDKYHEAFMNVKKAVEREKPKKPIKKYYTAKHGNHGTKKRVDIRCSCCNSAFANGVRTSIGVFASREKEFIETVKEIKYCPSCGNAVDWSENNEFD